MTYKSDNLCIPHVWNDDDKCGNCDADRYSLARLVQEGDVPIARPREDDIDPMYMVEGCFACGGPEDARRSFTAVCKGEGDDGNLVWLCQPCIRLICEQEQPNRIVVCLKPEDILVRAPALREAYLQGKVERTRDLPAGFVLAK